MHCRLVPFIWALTTPHCEPNRGNSIDPSKLPNATAASHRGDPGNSNGDLQLDAVRRPEHRPDPLNRPPRSPALCFAGVETCLLGGIPRHFPFTYDTILL
jgi:hypothetical protein